MATPEETQQQLMQTYARTMVNQPVRIAQLQLLTAATLTRLADERTGEVTDDQVRAATGALYQHWVGLFGQDFMDLAYTDAKNAEEANGPNTDAAANP